MTIQERLRSFKFDKDNMPRMTSETRVPVGLASEAANTIDELVAVLRRVVVQTGEYEREYHGSRPRSELWDSVADAKDLLAKLEGKR